ncbi:MAG: alpha-L-fucosidase [Verrucomicrobiota bacterium]|nr:alpha-L-fucosidase [Verrucomicrobiota bacterium]
MYGGVYKRKVSPRYAEWIMANSKIPINEYKKTAEGFNPVNYNPETWAQIAQDAGMKYLVITSKHHDGFALFDSKASKWNVVDHTKWKKDIIQPLAEACKKRGIKFGLYYSQSLDWVNAGNIWDKKNNPAITFDEYLKTISLPQVKEILTKYGEIDILWWDMPKNMTPERCKPFDKEVKKYPNLITNNRLGKGFKGDFGTREQYIPPVPDLKSIWESCMTMNHTWGYRSTDTDWKSTTKLIHNLIGSIAKGGNYLLNVGPKPDGTFPKASIKRLGEMGKWISQNKEAIYETNPTPFMFQQAWNGTCTTRELSGGITRLYLHVFEWPKDRKLNVLGLKNKIKKAYLLVDPSRSLKVHSSGNDQVISLPEKAPSKHSSTVVIDVKGRLDIKMQAMVMTADGMKLRVADAKRLKGAHYHAHYNSISSWKKSSSVEWDINIETPGMFIITAKHGNIKDSQMTFTIGNKSKEITFPKTGSFGWGGSHYPSSKIAQIKIPTGKHKLIIAPGKENWNPMHLQSIIIYPININQDENGNLSFPALGADFNSAKIVELDGALTNLTELETISWLFMITQQAGAFAVTMEYSAEENSQADLMIDNISTKITLPATGGDKRFLTNIVGNFTVPSSGKNKLILKPVSGKWHGVSIKKLELWLPKSNKEMQSQISTFPLVRADKLKRKHGDLKSFHPSKAIDNNSATAWETKFNEKMPVTLEIDYGREKIFKQLNIETAKGWNNIAEAELQYLKKGKWITIKQLKNIDGKQIINFPEIRSRFLRLIVKKCPNLKLYEFQAL